VSVRAGSHLSCPVQQIAHWLRVRNERAMADLMRFLAFSGLRTSEAVPLDWDAVDGGNKLTI
jgi:hypothetical protein